MFIITMSFPCRCVEQLSLYNPVLPPALAHTTALALAGLIQTGDFRILRNLLDEYILSPALLSCSLSTRLANSHQIKLSNRDKTSVT